MKKKKRNEHGHIAKRGENKYLVRWREDGKQVSKVVVGDYGHALSFLAQQLNPKHSEQRKQRSALLPATRQTNGRNTLPTNGNSPLRPLRAAS
jgi:hypothetical protein